MRLVAAACVVALLMGCSSTTASEEGGIGFTAGDGSVTIIAADEREPAPELAGETLEGEPLSTAQFAGQLIVLNVWGSWCAPCRAEAPELVAAAEAEPEVAFIGINTRDLDPAQAQAFVRSFEVPYPNIYDPDGALLLDFGQLPPKAIPSTLVIDDQGRVAARILGETSSGTLLGVLEEVRAG